MRFLDTASKRSGAFCWPENAGIKNVPGLVLAWADFSLCLLWQPLPSNQLTIPCTSLSLALVSGDNKKFPSVGWPVCNSRLQHGRELGPALIFPPPIVLSQGLSDPTFHSAVEHGVTFGGGPEKDQDLDSDPRGSFPALSIFDRIFSFPGRTI